MIFDCPMHWLAVGEMPCKTKKARLLLTNQRNVGTLYAIICCVHACLSLASSGGFPSGGGPVHEPRRTASKTSMPKDTTSLTISARKTAVPDE
jgi:hypothetical protein